MPIKYCYLGADRVGKNTTIAQKHPGLQFEHYIAPQPSDEHWYSQYDKPTEATIANRGPLEAGFYRPISNAEISDYIRNSPKWSRTLFILLVKPWGAELEYRHLEEIYELYPNGNHWYHRAQLIKRMHEHHDYYKHMHTTLYELNIDYVELNI